MKNIFSAITLLFSATLYGQYYYNDIGGTKDISDKMKAFVAARVQSVTATGYDQRGVKTTDFNEWQEVQENGKMLKVTSRNGQHTGRIYYRFDDQARLIHARDSASDFETNTRYSYDNKGNLVRIHTVRKDAQQDFNDTVEHQWHYSASGKPQKMWRILNGKDTAEYRFTTNEDGNIADETLYRKSVDKDTVYYYAYENQKVYYYYDDQHRLTDIVRYSKKAKQLLPDVMFEYDEKDRVIQKQTTLSDWPPDYLIWRYLFDEKGLKTKEALFSKKKELKGRIEYTYTFAP